MAARTIGQVIRERRRKRKWTQAQLALASGVSRRTIQYIENERVIPQKATASRLLRILT